MPFGGRGPGGQLAGQLMRAGDSNANQKLTRDEAISLADSGFAKLDTAKAGKVSQGDFAGVFRVGAPAESGSGGAGTGRTGTGRPGKDPQIGTWPEFNRMIGGFFKYHWLDPQLVAVKICRTKRPPVPQAQYGTRSRDSGPRTALRVSQTATPSWDLPLPPGALE